MHHLSEWANRCGGALRAAAVALDPGEDDVPDEQQFLDSLDAELRRDFAHASMAFAQARRRHRVKDTPMHRQAVLDGAARVDVVLDMYLMHLEIHRDLSVAAIA
jgi:hypothetical protein